MPFFHCCLCILSLFTVLLYLLILLISCLRTTYPLSYNNIVISETQCLTKHVDTHGTWLYHQEVIWCSTVIWEVAWIRNLYLISLFWFYEIKRSLYLANTSQLLQSLYNVKRKYFWQCSSSIVALLSLFACCLLYLLIHHYLASNVAMSETQYLTKHRHEWHITLSPSDTMFGCKTRGGMNEKLWSHQCFCSIHCTQVTERYTYQCTSKADSMASSFAVDRANGQPYHVIKYSCCGVITLVSNITNERSSFLWW